MALLLLAPQLLETGKRFVDVYLFPLEETSSLGDQRQFSGIMLEEYSLDQAAPVSNPLCSLASCLNHGFPHHLLWIPKLVNFLFSVRFRAVVALLLLRLPSARFQVLSPVVAFPILAVVLRILAAASVVLFPVPVCLVHFSTAFHAHEVVDQLSA